MNSKSFTWLYHTVYHFAFRT